MTHAIHLITIYPKAIIHNHKKKSNSNFVYLCNFSYLRFVKIILKLQVGFQDRKKAVSLYSLVGDLKLIPELFVQL